MKPPRNVIILCMKSSIGRKLCHRSSRKLLQTYEKWKRMNIPIRPDYVLSKLYKIFEKRFPTKIELEVTCTYEQNFRPIAMLIHVFENGNFTVRGISIEWNSLKRVRKRKERNRERAVSGCTHS